MKHRLKKIIWAVDAFNKDKDLMDHMCKSLRTLTRGAPTEVEPVYVLTPEQVNLP